jgi:CheY-like chemotaxis protein/HPt (histidine-containing phosphotransfer) domain-containing protein
MLEKLGCRVDVAANGHEVLAAIHHLAYDLLFMDCHMPEMDGYAATIAIRARETEQGGHLPIIAITANAMQGDRERCLIAGMDDYISKPVTPQALGAMLQQWTSNLVTVQAEEPPLAPQTARPVLDAAILAALRKLYDDDATSAGFTELIEQFIQETTDQLAALHSVLRVDDAAALEQLAHTLKATTSHLGALGMTKLCYTLQRLGRSGELAAAPGYVRQLDAEFARVRQALAAERATCTSSVNRLD